LNIRTRAICLTSLALWACAQESGPPVTIANVHILAPLPGSSTGTAYFSVENRNESPITIGGLTSPQFAEVEIHETRVSDGVSRMRQLDSVKIDGNSTAVFEPGGKHVMLIGPSASVLPGTSVTLEININDGLLIVSATMQDRLSVE